MKILVKPYSFDKNNRRITFTSYPSIALENVLLVTNVKTNDIIYNFADATLGGSLASHNILQLDYDTSTMVNTDPLQIFYDDGLTAVPVTDNSGSLTVDNNGTFAVQATQSGIWNSLATILNFPSTTAVTQSTSPWVTAGNATVFPGTVFPVSDNSSSLTVDNAGTFAVQATQAGAWSVNSLATILNFPSNQNVNLQDGSGNDISSTGGALDVNLASSDITLNTAVTSAPTISVQGTVTALITSTPTTPIMGTVTANAGTNLNTSALALESGGNLAAIAASLDTLDGTVNSGKIQVDVVSAPTTSVQGTVSANVISAPTLFAVVNTSAQGVTNSLATILNFPATQAVSGTVTANQGTSPWVVSGTATITPSGVVHVDDNASSLTVDNAGTFAVQASQTGIWNSFATVLNFPSNQNVTLTSSPTLFAVVNTGAVGVTNSLATILNFPTSSNATVFAGAAFPVTDNSGSLTVDNGGTFAVQAAQSGAWAVNSLATILNFPATTAVTQSTSPWVTAGNSTVFAGAAFPVTDNSSSLTVDNAGTFAVQVTSAPTLFAVVNTGNVDITSGATVNVMNFPATQVVSGTVNSLATILNFPATFGVTQSTSPWVISGTATTTIASAPTLFAVVNAPDVNLTSGATVNVMNFPATQVISGNATVFAGAVFPVSDNSSSLTVDNGGTFAVQVTSAPTISVQGTVSTNVISAPTLFAVVNTDGAGITSSLATILNFPATQAVTQSTSPWVVSGNATVFAGAAFPVTDNGGAITVDNGGTFAVQAAQSGTWTVNSLATINNFPATQAVTQSGVWSNFATILNFPSSQNVVVTSAPTTPVTGTVTADTELPAAAAQADNLSDPTTTGINVYPAYRDGSDGNWDRARALSAALNTTAAGSGIAPAGMTAQFDDASTTTITENNWGNLRISTNRNLYQTIRDAAGNERGANVDASNRLSVSVDNTATITNAADMGRTLQSAGGAVSASGDNTIIAGGAGKQKVYAFSISTLSTTAITAIFKGGSTELWRAVLQAPTNVSTGANLAVTPPAYLFASASGATVYLNLSSAATVNWAASYFTEA